MSKKATRIERLSKAKQKAQKLQPFVLVPDFMSISATPAKKASDCVVKAVANSDGSVTLHLDRAVVRELTAEFSEITEGTTQCVFTPTGSKWTRLPIADLVVVPKDKFEPVTDDSLLSDQSYAEHLEDAERANKKNQLKAGQFFWLAGYERVRRAGKRSNIETLVESVSNEDFHEGVALEKRFDGVPVALLKASGRVSIVTDALPFEGADITERLPELAQKFEALSNGSKPSTLSMAAELEMWSGGRPVSGVNLREQLYSDEPLDERRIVAHVLDILFENGTDLHNVPLKERRAKLEAYAFEQSTMMVPDSSKTFNLSPMVPVYTREGLSKQSVLIMGSPGSKGVVLKSLASHYDLEGPTYAVLHKNILVRGVVVEKEEIDETHSCYTLGVHCKNPIASIELDGITYGGCPGIISKDTTISLGDIAEAEVEGVTLFYYDNMVGFYFENPYLIGASDVDMVDSIGSIVDKSECVDLFSIESVSKAASPWPESDKEWKYVIQHHYRGKSVHADLRMAADDHFIGWTVMDQKPDTIKEPVETLKDAVQYDADPSNFKVNWNKGELDGNIEAAPKKQGSKEWMEVEGVSNPDEDGGAEGVFHIIDKGKVTYGAQKEDFHEYFFGGGSIEGRLIFRKIARRDSGTPKKEEGSDSTPYYWIFTRPKDQTPYVLSKGAVEKGWVPPEGFSALPPEIKKSVPLKHRYWKMSSKSDRREARDALVSERKTAGQKGAGKSQESAVKTQESAAKTQSIPDPLTGSVPQELQTLPKHTTYVEPFVDSGVQLWNKPKSQREILTSPDRSVVEMLKDIKSIPDKDMERFDEFNWEVSEKSKERARLAKDSSDPVRNLWRYVTLTSTTKSQKWSGLKFMKDYKDRLSQVTLENTGYAQAVRKYDSQDTLFYLNPNPDIRLVELLKVCKGIRGKFVLDIPYSDKATQIFEAFHIKQFGSPSRFVSEDEWTEDSRKLLVTNFEVETSAQKKSSPTKFKLIRRFWREPREGRFGETSEIWDFVVKDEGEYLHYELSGNPTDSETKAFLSSKGERGRELFEIDVSARFPINSHLNVTKDLPAWGEVFEEGDAAILEDSFTMKKILVKGTDDEATLIFTRESKKESTWEVSCEPDASSGMFVMEITQKSEDEHIVGGIVYEPNTYDAERDWADPEVIRKAMYWFQENGLKFDIQHELPFSATVLETFQAEEDTTKGGKVVPKGAWYMSLRINDSWVWELIKAGELRGFSWEGDVFRQEDHPIA